MRIHGLAVAVNLVLAALATGQSTGSKFTARTLNKDSVMGYDRDGVLSLKVEISVTLTEEIRIKEGDFRLAYWTRNLNNWMAWSSQFRRT